MSGKFFARISDSESESSESDNEEELTTKQAPTAQP